MKLICLLLLFCCTVCCLGGCKRGASTEDEESSKTGPVPEWSLVLRQGAEWAVQIKSSNAGLMVLLPTNSLAGWRMSGIFVESGGSITIPLLSEFVEITVTNSERYDGLQLVLDNRRLVFPKWLRSSTGDFMTEAHSIPLRPLIGGVHVLTVKHGAEKNRYRDYPIHIVPSLRIHSPLFYNVTRDTFVLAIGRAGSSPTNWLVFTHVGSQAFLAERHLEWRDLQPFINVASDYQVVPEHLMKSKGAKGYVTKVPIYTVQAYLRWLKEESQAPGVFRFQSSEEQPYFTSAPLSPNRYEVVSDPVPQWHEQDAVRLLRFQTNMNAGLLAAPVNYPFPESTNDVYFRICYDEGPLHIVGSDSGTRQPGAKSYRRASGAGSPR